MPPKKNASAGGKSSNGSSRGGGAGKAAALPKRSLTQSFGPAGPPRKKTKIEVDGNSRTCALCKRSSEDGGGS